MKNEHRIFLFKIIPAGLISRLFGYITLISFPAVIINFAVKKYSEHFGINTGEYEIPEGGFLNFNMFFTRKLKEGARKIDSGKKSIVSPVDALIYEYGDIRGDSIIQAKGIDFSLADLVPSASASKFRNGKFITLYLSPADYHRIHSPADGEVTGYFHIPGRLFTVQEYMVNGLRGLFSKNERLITYISASGGDIAVVKVGAMNVGKISHSFSGTVTNRFIRRRKEVLFEKNRTIPVLKGDEAGMFNLGSTVILLFSADMIEFEPLKKGSRIKVGEKIAALK